MIKNTISMGQQALRDARTDRKNACMSASSSPPVSDSPTRLRLSIHGRVQGVWFRDSVRRRADEHGVNGWAENLPDGSVQAVLEGDPAAVRAVAVFCRAGPRHARVDHVDEYEEEAEGLQGFEIR
jgi:acylphosphatase